VRCETEQQPCLVEAPVAWEPEFLGVVTAARGYLARVGAWPVFERPLLVVTGAPVHALTVADAAPHLGASFAGRPAVLLSDDVWPDVDVVVHELTHAWLQQVAGPGPRWTVKDGVASTQRAALHEAVADFLAASHAGRAMVGRASTPPQLEARTLTELRRCPNDWTGSAHDDSVVVSSALWALRERVGDAAVVRAVVTAAPRAETVTAFSAAMGAALEDSAKPAWTALVEARGLTACEAPITVQPGTPFSATVDRFWVPGLAEVDAGTALGAPQAFRLKGRQLEDVTVSVQATKPLSLEVSTGHARFRVPLGDGPRPKARFRLEPPADEVQVRVVSSQAGPAAYNDVVMAGASAPSTAPEVVVGALLAVVGVVAAGTWWRRRARAEGA
jgi:hypothetical protein